MNLPKGIRARKQRSGKVYYYYDTGGMNRVEIPLGSDYVLALKKWGEIENDKGFPHLRVVTFRYVAERYLREVVPTKAPRTQKDNFVQINKLYEFFDDPPAPLEDIKPIHIRQYLDWRREDVRLRIKADNEVRAKERRALRQLTGKEGEVRANREKALFSHIWNKSREWGLTDLPNPCHGVKGFKERGRDAYIDDATFKAVWDAADWAIRDAMDLAYLTGQRPADVLKLSRTDIKDGALWITQNKTGKKLRIVIEGDLANVIERITSRRYKSFINIALVVNERGDRLSEFALKSRFTKARKRAEEEAETAEQKRLIKSFQFRDIRAKAGTDKESAEGMSAAKDLLVHADEKMTGHYVRHRVGKLVKPTR